MRFIAVIFTILVALGNNASASDYNYLSPEALKNDIENGGEMLVVDIQVEEEFTQHHIKGSIPTYAYPAKNASDTAKLDAVTQQQKETGKSVVIICPRGAGGAKRSYDYLRESGMSEDKLLILEKGMKGWPYPELTVGR